MEKKFINVLDDSFELYELCKKEGWTDCETWDEWFENGGELSFFEGDPDMIKVDGEIGYFCECGDTVFYYADDFGCKCSAEDMLRAFFNAHQTGVTLGCYSWISGKEPEGVNCDDDIQNWEAWEKIENGIVWRGGAGYSYTIYDYEGFANQMAGVLN